MPQRRSPDVPHRSLRRAALIAWALVLVGWSLTRGLPVDRTSQTLFWLGLLLAANVGTTWARKGRVLLDWLPFVTFLYVYDYSRGLAHWFGATTHVQVGVDADRLIGGGQVPTVAMQDWLYDPRHIHWYDVLAAVVYTSHFFVAWTIAVVLYLRSPADWARWVRRLLVLSYAGLVTFVVFPAAPPWYAAKAGLIDPVARISGRGFSALHLHAAGVLLEKGQAAANNVAAIPSLHAGLPLLITMVFWSRLGLTGRLLLVVYTVAMGAALVYSGEHYVVDLLAGYAYVVGAVVAVGRWERRRDARPAALVAEEQRGTVEPIFSPPTEMAPGWRTTRSS